MTAPGVGDNTVRRPADLLRLVVAAALLALLVAVAVGLPRGTHGFDQDVANALRRLPHPVVLVAAALAALSAVVLVAALAIELLRRRRRDITVAFTAGLGGAVGAIIAVAIWHSTAGPVAQALLGSSDGSMFVRDVAIVAFLTGSDLGRHARWLRPSVIVVTVALVTGLALVELTPLGVMAIPLAGWAAGLAARFALGIASAAPDLRQLSDALAAGGVGLVDLAAVPGKRGRYSGKLENGSPMSVVVASPDTEGAGVAGWLWSSLRLRAVAAGHQPFTLRGQLERESLASALAVGAGLAVPRVLLFTEIAPDVVVLAREELSGASLATVVPEGDAPQKFFAALHRLHSLGVAHRHLQPENLLMMGPQEPSGNESGALTTVGFRTIDHCAVAAGELMRRLDVVQMLVTMAQRRSPREAIEALHAGYSELDERALAALVQPIALAPWGHSATQAAKATLSELRKDLLGPAQIPPEIRLERFRIRTVVTFIAVTLAAFVLIGQLSTINLIGTLGHANLFWLAVALAGSSATYIGAAVNISAFLPRPPPFLRTVMAELSTAFVNLVTPPTVGQVALNLRYLQRSGIDATTAGACIAISQVTSIFCTVVMLAIAGFLAGTTANTHLDILPGPRLLAVLGGALVALALLAAIPALRKRAVERVWPRIRATLPRLIEVVSQPMRLVAGISGNLLLTVSYVVALVASLHALGSHPPIIATAAVYIAGNTVGSAAPTPGGLGAVEAVLVAGLAAIGIHAHQALPAVLLFRAATFWLPALPGWASFIVLQRRGAI